MAQKINTFYALTQGLKYGASRQSVLNDNISRANMPREKARDLENFALNSTSNKIDLKITHPKHINSKFGSAFKIILDKEETEMTPDGNNINLTEQMKKINDNNIFYQTISSTYKKFMNLMKTTFTQR